MGGEKLPLRNAAVPVGTFPSDSVIIPALNLAEILFSVGWFSTGAAADNRKARKVAEVKQRT